MKDKQIKKLIDKETRRQDSVINLIASENYPSADVREALGSVFMDQYAEGYPGRRYYGGLAVIDELERLTQNRAREVFGLSAKKWHVNVQALSGTPANLAIYHALVPIGGSIMGMALDAGGHLSHGYKVSVTGKLWEQISYGVDEDTQMIDYEQLLSIAKKRQPDIIVAGFSAYPRKINWKKFREIADAGNALLMVDMSHIAGLVAGRAHTSPFPYADIVMTTTHKTLRGPRGALIFSRIDERKIPSKIDKSVFPGLQGGPHMDQVAATAVALYEAHAGKFKTYAQKVVENAKVLATTLKSLGWKLVSGGTDTHLILVDVYATTGMGGEEAQARLEAAGIIVNKNAIPFDSRTPNDPSGIRLGTAAETTRGKKKKDFDSIARTIDNILRS
ncbi:MAG: glycine hydroxymethyltransferase [Planctomycetota bacterium]|jgi:glycine hydroxymethyltransferase